MFTPLATAKLIAIWPEWNSVPSPMFWKRCRVSVKGEMPTHWAPSPPICVRPMISPKRAGSIQSAML